MVGQTRDVRATTGAAPAVPGGTGTPGRVTRPEPSDDALLRAARLGDEAAFAQIVERYGRQMFRYALRQVGGSEADAAEATQEAFISAWRSLPSFRGESSIRTWLFRLVHRRAADLTRRRKPTPVEDDALVDLVTPGLDDAMQHVLDEELLAALQDALDQLPWQQRSVWLLREIEGLSYQEIGDALALPVSTVRGLLARARPTLAERMARWR